MAMDDLFTALNMFKQGVGQLQTSRVIGQANEAVQTIRASEGNEQAKRAQLQDVSNQLVGHMTALGNPVSAIQQVAQQFGPKQFASADAAILEGTLSGNKQLTAMGVQADTAANANKMQMFNAQTAASEASQKRLFEHQATVEMMKERAKANLPAKGQGDLEFGANYRVAMLESKKLEKLIGEDGNWEMWNPESSAKLKSAAYQLAINYAKIVDPASVAREGEVKAAEQYLIPMGPGTRNSVSLAAVKEYQAKISEYAKARTDMKNEASGRTPVSQSAAAPAGGGYFKPYK